jgi:heme/copper-type cytochrome/quinol oxidase subunit 2
MKPQTHIFHTPLGHNLCQRHLIVVIFLVFLIFLLVIVFLFHFVSMRLRRATHGVHREGDPTKPSGG